MSGPLPEPQVVTATSRRGWIALLSGPALWFGHFMAVYVLAEIACAAEALQTPLAGLDLLRWTIIAVTVLVIAAIGVVARMTWSYRGRDAAPIDPVLAIGVGLDALFAFAVVVTAVPVLVLTPC